jgi:hypothetical protein
MERVGEMYDEYFYSVSHAYWRAGWYQENTGRAALDWLTKRYFWVVPAARNIVG